MNLVVTKMNNYFPVYIHVPKLEPSCKKGTFVGYCNSSKNFRIYIPRSKQIEVNRDVTFEEEMAIRKGRGSDMEIDDEEMRSSPPPNIKRESEEMNKPINSIDTVELDDAPTRYGSKPEKTQMGTTDFAETSHGADGSIE